MKVHTSQLKYYALILIAFILAFSSSCKKEQDNSSPMVDIIAPIANTSYEIFDSVHVIVTVSDDTQLDFVRVSIVDADQVSIVPDKYYFPTTSSMEIDTYMHISEPYLDNGEYFVMVRAGDTRNTKNGFVSILINELPQEVLSYYVLTKQNIQKTQVNVLTPAFEADSTFEVWKTFNLAAIDSRHNQFYYINQTPSEIDVFDISSFDLEYTIPGPMPYPEYYEAVMEKYFYVSTGSGEIFGYDASGQNIYQTERRDEFIIENFNMNSEFVLADNVARSGAERFVVLYYREWGVLKSEWRVLYDVEAIVPYHDRFITFSNDVDGIKVHEVQPLDLVITQLNQLSGYTVLSASKLTENMIVVLTNSHVLLYENDLNRFSTYIPNMNASKMVYDSFNGYLFFVKGQEVEAYQAIPSALIQKIPFEQEVLDFQIRYIK